MAVTMKQMALAVTVLGLISFVFGIVAENKKVLYFLFIYLQTNPVFILNKHISYLLFFL